MVHLQLLMRITTSKPKLLAFKFPKDIVFFCIIYQTITWRCLLTSDTCILGKTALEPLATCHSHILLSVRTQKQISSLKDTMEKTANLCWARRITLLFSNLELKQIHIYYTSSFDRLKVLWKYFIITVIFSLFSTTEVWSFGQIHLWSFHSCVVNTTRC